MKYWELYLLTKQWPLSNSTTFNHLRLKSHYSYYVIKVIIKICISWCYKLVIKTIQFYIKFKAIYSRKYKKRWHHNVSNFCKFLPDAISHFRSYTYYIVYGNRTTFKLIASSWAVEYI